MTSCGTVGNFWASNPRNASPAPGTVAISGGAISLMGGMGGPLWAVASRYLAHLVSASFAKSKLAV
ncbi:Uncharacterised protein [Mycobacteroides abscessus subsp. massiliense]|nr:Uncharacterised protein [Mycobacteroides abscessus subsp. massiliense]